MLLGEIKSYHSYNGTIVIPRGWMQCNGDVINSTNYDFLHGAGSYVSDGIGDMLLAGKYTPNLTNRYLIGAATTTASGSSTIGTTGNASHQINLTHSHTHSHIWHNYFADNAPSRDGQAASLTGTTGSNGSLGIVLGPKDSSTVLASTSSTDSNSTTNLSSTQSIKPESIEVIYIIRVGI